MANSKEKIAEFVRNNLLYQPDPDAIPRMSRMLYVDRSITDINIKDSKGWTALYYQAWQGTTGNMAWLLRQDPPAYIDIRNPSHSQWTPLMAAAWSPTDPEGKVRLLIEYGADRDLVDEYRNTALWYARLNNKPAVVIDLLENYRPDVSR